MMHKVNLEEIINLYYDEIKRYCHYKLPNDFHGAEDCTQEVFFILLKKHRELYISERIHTWLYKTADRVIRNYLRKEKKHTHVPLEDVEFSSDGGLSAILNDTPLDALTEQERQILTAYYSSDYHTKQDVALQFGMTLPTLYVVISRIKKKLKSSTGTNNAT